MSFLNPVNEPVLRFSSTDASAPQINYAARVAGDVKAVLKACLATGYGVKESVEWSVINEVGNVCEFVSPSAAMSDHKLGINDTAASTAWSYSYMGTTKTITDNTVAKTLYYVSEAHASNRWDLVASKRSFYFIESFYSASVAGLVSRVTFFGGIKSATASDGDIAFWSMGFYGALSNPADALSRGSGYYASMGVQRTFNYSAANLSMAISQIFPKEIIPTIDVISPLYIQNKGSVIAQHSGLLLRIVGKESDLFGVADSAIDGRPCLCCFAARPSSTKKTISEGTVGFMIYLDYWEY